MKILSFVASTLLAASTCLAQVQMPAVAGSLTYPKIVSEGREPRKSLRYAPEVGLVDKVEVTLKQKITATASRDGTTKHMDRDEILRFTVRAEVTKQSQEETELSIEVLAVVAADPDAKSTELKTRNDVLAKLKGAKGTVAIKRNGLVSGMQFTPEGAIPAEGTQALEDLKQNFQQLLPILPKEPLGQGATWVLHGVGVDPKANKNGNEKELTYTVQGGPKDRVVIAASATRGLTPKDIGLDAPGLPATGSKQRLTTTAEYVLMDGRALPFRASSSNRGVLDVDAKDPSSGKNMRAIGEFEQAISLKQLPSPPPKSTK